MDINEYRKQFSSESATPGWAAIDYRLAEVYPSVEPAHYAPCPHYALEGNDPLDGISIYHCAVGEGWHYHCVTYGFSILYYDEEAAGGEFSGHGFELTFRLKPFAKTQRRPLGKGTS
jgi:hypothetical protein